MHIAALQIYHATIADIVNLIVTIGNACGAQRQADSVAGSISRKIDRIRELTEAGLVPASWSRSGAAWARLPISASPGKTPTTMR